MGDFSTNKEGLGDVHRENQIATAWEDGVPLITPDQLKLLFLFGIPLVSYIKDPITKRPAALTDADLKSFIIEAVSEAELESKIEIFPTQYEERHAFDRAAMDSFGFFQLRHRPCSAIQKISIMSSENKEIMNVPLTWVDTGLLHQGQINLIPINVVVDGSSQQGMAMNAVNGNVFPLLFSGARWIPSFITIKYSSGFKESLIPRVVNNYIGTIAAMRILSLLATTFARTNSSALSIDGLSQSMSSPGPNIYAQRIQDLGINRKWLISRLQAMFNMQFLVDNV